jgi:transposase
MPKTRPPYAPEFRRQMVVLVRACSDPEDLSREFEPTAQSIRLWVAVADRQEACGEEKSDVGQPAELPILKSIPPSSNPPRGRDRNQHPPPEP